MSYSSEVLADTPWAYYRLDESSGVAVDSSGNSRNGSTWTGTPTRNQAGAIVDGNDAVSLSGTQYFSSPQLPNISDYSVECWVKASTTNQRAILGNNTSGDVWQLRWEASGVINWITLTSGFAQIKQVQSAGGFNDNNWHHIVGTVSWNGTNRIAKLYIDGSLAASDSTATVASTIPNNAAYKMYVGFISGIPYFSGVIDEVAFYSSALSATRVGDHYTAGITSGIPANTVAPALSGTATVGSVLSTDNGTWTNSPTSYTYKWQVSDNGSTGWSDIGGATASTFTLTSSEGGKYVRSVVTAINGGGSASANSSTSSQITYLPTNSVVPSFTGAAAEDEVLSGSAGTWSAVPSASYAYKWQVSDTGSGGWSDIVGATSINYTLTSAEVGKYVRLAETATNAVGSATAYSTSSAVIVGLPVNTVAPVASGINEPSENMSCTSGTWLHSPSYAYQWQVSDDGIIDWSDIGGATAATFVGTESEDTLWVRCEVTATNAAGATVAYSNALEPTAGVPYNVTAPSTTGEYLTGTVLSAIDGSWGGMPAPTLTYQWQVSDDFAGSWANIASETADTYTIPSDANAKTFRVKITATNDEGSAVAYSDDYSIVPDDDYSEPESAETRWDGKGESGGQSWQTIQTRPVDGGQILSR